MAATHEQIINFLLTNPSDAEVAKAMETYGVSPADIAKVTGTSEGEIAARVAATLPPNQAVLLGDTYVQAVNQTIGSGQDQQVGGLQNVITYKADENKVGGGYNQYTPTGELERTGTQQNVSNSLTPFVLGSLGLFGGLGGGLEGLTGGSEVAGMGGAQGITGGSSGLGLNAATGGLGLDGLGAGITAGSGLTGTGILTGSGLGTSLLGDSALAGLVGTGVLSGSTLGAGIGADTLGTGLTGTGVLTGSGLGTGVAGVDTGVVGGTGVGTGVVGGTGTGVVGGTGTGVGTGTGGVLNGVGSSVLGNIGAGLNLSDIIKMLGIGTTLAGLTSALNKNTDNTQKGYDIVPVPAEWKSPIAGTTASQATLSPVNFGSNQSLAGTQWEKFLSPNYGKVSEPVQYSQPSNLSYNDLMGILGSKQGMPSASSLSINDIISGIQNQYGQTASSTMG